MITIDLVISAISFILKFLNYCFMNGYSSVILARVFAILITHPGFLEKFKEICIYTVKIFIKYFIKNFLILIFKIILFLLKLFFLFFKFISIHFIGILSFLFTKYNDNVVEKKSLNIKYEKIYEYIEEIGMLRSLIFKILKFIQMIL